jgi:hypothetical protein
MQIENCRTETPLHCPFGPLANYQFAIINLQFAIFVIHPNFEEGAYRWRLQGGKILGRGKVSGAVGRVQLRLHCWHLMGNHTWH